MSAETFTKMTRLLAHICATDADNIESDIPLRSYGLDSVGAFELAILIEDTFEIRMRTEVTDALRSATVADLVQLIDRVRKSSVFTEFVRN